MVLFIKLNFGLFILALMLSVLIPGLFMDGNFNNEEVGKFNYFSTDPNYPKIIPNVEQAFKGDSKYTRFMGESEGSHALQRRNLRRYGCRFKFCRILDA